MPSKLPIITFRTDEESNAKFKFIANAHNRKINDELKMLIGNHINKFESENGKLIIDENGKVEIERQKIKNKLSNSKIG